VPLPNYLISLFLSELNSARQQPIIAGRCARELVTNPIFDTKITRRNYGSYQRPETRTYRPSFSAPEPVQHITWTDAVIEQLRRSIPDNQCPIYLSTKFCNKFSCTRHINIVHLKRRPHGCAACEKPFGLRQLLQKHLDSKLNRICKPFYQDFLEQSNLANRLKENLRQLDGKGLVRLYSVLL
jgi:hypothetical protein